jgi:hypothetical protein
MGKESMKKFVRRAITAQHGYGFHDGAGDGERYVFVCFSRKKGRHLSIRFPIGNA